MKKILFFLIIAALLSFRAFGDDDNLNSDKAVDDSANGRALPVDDFQKGLKFAEEGSFWEALGAFKSYLKDHPDSFEVCYNLAGAYLSLGKCDDSIIWYKKALKLKHGDSDALIGLGISLRLSSQQNKAIPVLKEAVKNSSGNARAMIELALAYQSVEEFKSAVVWYERALKVDPQDQAVYNFLGMVYGIMGNYDKAAEAFHAAIKIDPEYADAYLSLGAMLIAQQKKTGTGGGFAQAREELNIARALFEKTGDNKSVERIDGLLKNIDN